MKALWTRDGVTHRGEHFTVVDERIEQIQSSGRTRPCGSAGGGM